MVFVVHAATYGQQFSERFVGQRVSVVSKPRQERGVYSDDLSVWPSHNVAAGCVLIQILDAFVEAFASRRRQGAETRSSERPLRLSCHVAPANAAIACAVTSGALSWGQCPVLSSVTSSLPSMCCCTYAPTWRGAKVSCAHSITSVRTDTP